MKNITALFKELYTPRKALLIHQSMSDETKVYVEAYDIDENNKPFNAHPLSIQEAAALAESLTTSAEFKNEFLISENLLPEKVLYVNPQKMGYAIWYTPEQKVNLLFKKELGIPCGKANVPAMIWKAQRNELKVFAVKTIVRPDVKTPLCYAPFFNIHESGSVCMGTVEIEIEERCGLEDFIMQWESYFWNSYFSHMLESYSPVKINIVELWQNQISSKKKFPTELLIKNGQTIKNLLQ